MKGKLYLIPSPLGEYDPALVLPAPVLELLHTINCYVVEEVRTARRFLSAAGLKGHIEGLEFHTLNEHSSKEDIEALGSLFDKGDVGLISEAGLPAVADPGADLVALCHRKGIEVVPLVGPSSIMLALMASGFNGQNFAFNGYAPIKLRERDALLKRIEVSIHRDNQTQIFIEAPYRNNQFLDYLAHQLQPLTRICVAADLTLPTQYIRARLARQWLDNPPDLNKRPAIFLLYK